MNHLRRVGTAVVVAVFSVGMITASASAASADDGVSAKKNSTGTVSTQRRDSGWY